jgi:hypothetical protein
MRSKVTMNNLLKRVATANALTFVVVASCAAAATAIQIDGAVTQAERFVPGVPPGTSWNMNLVYDDTRVVRVRQLPGYNATYHVPLVSGEYRIGGNSSPLDDLTLVVFDNSVAGGDEIDLYPGFHGLTQLTVGLFDSSGHTLTDLAFPKMSALTLASFTNQIVSFDEDSPLVGGTPGGSYNQATVTSFSATSVVPEPPGSSLAAIALLSLVIASRMARRS